MAVQIQLRRGSAANWSSTNPILAQGELGYELDTGKFKIGNGVNAWNTLGYTFGNTLSGLADVAASNPSAGSLLVYQTSINKWVASTTLDQQNMDAGEF